MNVTTAVRKLSVPDADRLVADGAAYVDLRRVPDYLDVHVPASLSLEYEFGPGMPGRARDCIPLGVRLVILENAGSDRVEVTEALRGKGFIVEGTVEDGVEAWADVHGAPRSTETVTQWGADEGTVLDVGDPGARVPEGAVSIPISRLWARMDEVTRGEPVVIAAGRGVRAALAVGMLERAGIDEIVFWRTAS